MKSILLLGLCFMLSLVLVFGSVNSPYSYTLSAFASDEGHTPEDSDGGDNNHGDDNQGGDSGDQGNDHSDGSRGMPPPEDARQTTDTITAGGGSDDDDDIDNDDSEGDEDDSNDNDNDDPQIPKDAPATTDVLTAKKLECPKGQEVALFSTSCAQIGVTESTGNSGGAAPTPNPNPNPNPTECRVSYSPEESDRSSVWMKNEHLMQINPGVFYYTARDNGIQQQQLSLFHKVQGMQLGKTYDLSSYSGTECNINQVRNKDGSITATITFPNHVKQVIRTDTTGKVPIQINTLDYYDKIFVSEAVDNNGIATTFKKNVGGVLGEPGLQGIETTEPGGTRPIISVVLDSKDGSLKILGRGALGQSSVARHELQDDNDGDPTVATTKSGMKVTVTPFNVAYPNPGATNDDPAATMYSDHSVFRVTNPDSSVKTHMIINPDGSVQPGSKWTAGAPVEPEDE